MNAMGALRQGAGAPPASTRESWPSLDAFLADLAESLAPLHNLRTHPVGQSVATASGDPKPDLVRDPVIRAFFQGPSTTRSRDYLRALGPGDDLVRSRNLGDYAFNGAWSVRLRADGFHADHLHPRGWLSSAFAMALPRAIETGREGWLRFGQPGVPTVPPLEPEHFVKPEPGLLVLFPSYTWHRDGSFSGDEPRLTIMATSSPKLGDGRTRGGALCPSKQRNSLRAMTTDAQTTDATSPGSEPCRSAEQNGAIDLAMRPSARNLEHPLVLRLVAPGSPGGPVARKTPPAASPSRHRGGSDDFLESWTDFGRALGSLHRHARSAGGIPVGVDGARGSTPTWEQAPCACDSASGRHAPHATRGRRKSRRGRTPFGWRSGRATGRLSAGPRAGECALACANFIAARSPWPGPTSAGAPGLAGGASRHSFAAPTSMRVGIAWTPWAPTAKLWTPWTGRRWRSPPSRPPTLCKRASSPPFSSPRNERRASNRARA